MAPQQDQGRPLESATAVREVLELLNTLLQRFSSGDPALPDEQSQLEAFRWIFTILQVGCDAFLWPDTQKPRFVDIVGATKKWGGDNADAFYQYVALDPRRSYRVVGIPGDAPYFSLTVYGGPSDGRYSERIVGSSNQRDAKIAPDGTIEVLLSPAAQPGNSIQLEPDAVCAITRDYLNEPKSGTRMQWQIECLDGEGDPNFSDAELASRLSAVKTWIADQANITPLALGEPNTVEPPYPVPNTTFGWAAGDAAYAMGSFRLAADEALVISGRSPECAFWNLCLWNAFLHTYNYDYDRVTINGSQVVYETDGSWEIVVAAHDPGHHNWISTQGHSEGRLWFRWFLPASTPEQPRVQVITIDNKT